MLVRRAVWAVVVLLFAGFAVAGPAIMVRDAVGAGGDGSQDEAAVTRAGDEPLVVMADLQFQPVTLRVPAGTTVLWSNQDVAPHTVTTEAADSGLIDPGGSFTMIVTASFEYVCTLHPSMEGSVQVI